MVRLLKITSLLLIVESCYAELPYAMFHGGLVKTAKWYFAPNGNDDNHGHSTDAPLQTIAKLNTLTLEPGDSVLFLASSTFTGQINVNQSGTLANPIVITSYGSGAKPIIKGSEVLTGWVWNGENIYACKASTLVKNLFANGVQQIRARYPNYNTGTHPLAGLIPIAATNGTTTITATAINQAGGYWTGSTIHIKGVAWRCENKTVTSYDGTTLTFGSLGTFTTAVNRGFYLDNLKVCLDTVNEWYCDPVTNSVYFWASGGVNPSTLTVEGSTIDYGITSSKSNITVQNLDFQQQANTALYFTGTDSLIRIQSVDVSGSNVSGINISGTSTKDTITNCVVNGVNKDGISACYASHSNISSNTLKNCGLVYGYSSQGYGILTFAGSYNLIQSNDIDSIGYTGIFAGGNSTIQKNLIKHTMLTLGDGGGIYLSQSQNSIIRHNMISDVPGGIKGSSIWTLDSPWWASTSAYGIYLDQNINPPTSLMTVDSNTVLRAQCGGIYFNYSDTACTARDNTLFNCGTSLDGSGILIAIDTTRPGYGTHVVAKNIIFSRNAKPMVKTLQYNLYKRYQPVGRIDSNFYATTVGSINFNRYTASPSANHILTLHQWKVTTGHDAHATTIYKTLASGTDSLFSNSTDHDSTVTLGDVFHNPDGTVTTSPFMLGAYSSVVLIHDAVVSPTVTTVTASSATETTATLNGTVTPNTLASTFVRFVFGTAKNTYTDSVTANRSPLSGWKATKISKALTGLTTGRIYYFRAVASNSSYYLRGNELTFATGALDPDKINKE